VVAGAYGPDSILLLRLTPAGQLDPTFGPAGNGLVKLTVGSIADSVAIDDDGRILVGASNLDAAGRPMVVARFSPDGILDRSFGQNGIVQLIFWDATAASGSGVNALNVAADGSVTGSGHIDYIGNGGHGTAGVFQLSPRGELVPGFGSGGHTEVGFTKASGTPAQWFPCAMTVDSRGRIVVSGDGEGDPGNALLNARLTPTGTLDTSYGTAGTGRVVIGGLGTDIDGQTNCGAAVNARNAVTTGVGATLVQVTSNGTPNTGFGPGGFVSIGVPANVTLLAVTPADAGRIVLAGFAGDAIYVARYKTR